MVPSNIAKSTIHWKSMVSSTESKGKKYIDKKKNKKYWQRLFFWQLISKTFILEPKRVIINKIYFLQFGSM